MNKTVGEREIELCGEKLKLRPSFGAFQTIERIIGYSATKIAKDFVSDGMKVSDVAAVIYACQLAANPESKLTLEQIGAAILAEEKLVEANVAAVELVGTLYSGSQKKTKNPSLEPN